jgi:putative membrane protein
MIDIVIRVAIIAIALIAAVFIVPGAEFTGEWWQLAAIAAIFGLINAYLRPIVKLLSLPLNLIGFGLVGFVINTGLLLLVAFVSGQFDLGLSFAGWPSGAFDLDVVVAAFLTSLVISIVSTALALVRVLVPGV